MPDAKPCSVDDCDYPARKIGLCSGHYQRHRSGKPLDGPLRAKLKNGEKPGPCSVADCGRQVFSAGFCGTHYYRQRAGKPLDDPIRALVPRAGTCSVSGCDREIFASGMCAAHSVRARTGVPLDDKPIRKRRRNDEPDAVCSMDGCEKLAKGGNGLCKTHWATATGKSTEYAARRRSLKFDGPHEKITAADHRALRAATDDCYLCGEPLADPVEFDHIMPLSKGGRHVLANLAPVHKRCNRLKYTSIVTPPDRILLPRQPGLWEEVR